MVVMLMVVVVGALVGVTVWGNKTGMGLCSEERLSSM